MKICATGSTTIIGAFLVAFAAVPVTAMAGPGAQSSRHAGWMADGLDIEVAGSSQNQDMPSMIADPSSLRHGAGWMAQKPDIPTATPTPYPTAALVTIVKVPFNTGWRVE